jgi:hypothetical protein
MHPGMRATGGRTPLQGRSLPASSTIHPWATRSPKSSSRGPHKPGDVCSTHRTWSHWSAPAHGVQVWTTADEHLTHAPVLRCDLRACRHSSALTLTTCTGANGRRISSRVGIRICRDPHATHRHGRGLRSRARSCRCQCAARVWAKCDDECGRSPVSDGSAEGPLGALSMPARYGAVRCDWSRDHAGAAPSGRRM